LKIQANLIAILPHRVTMVNLTPSQAQQAAQQNRGQPSQPQPQPDLELDGYPDPDQPF
jgi:single-strand DNA-binding protein